MGRHSRLSSLLRPYQSLRSHIRSAEAPVESEDPFARWILEDFDDAANPVFLKLAPPEVDAEDAREVYLYEVNYSVLAGVIRENHRLDITHLFVSLDLAVNVARNRLLELARERSGEDAGAEERAALRYNLELARVAQGLTGVLVAATVPILGLPSILLQQYLAPFLADFTRFFEDVATFALDRNGEALVNTHVDHTIGEIQKRRGADDEFVVVAHSLGSVVTHSHLVRKWADPGAPDRVLTLGSPIGLVSWMWRFLDFRGARFDAYEPQYATPYFCWTPRAPAKEAGRALEWVNVVNYLDPIATAFPPSDVYLGMPPERISGRLQGGAVAHHFIRTGGLFSLGAAHTQYFEDKTNFLQLLGKMIPLLPDEVVRPKSLDAGEHWNDSARALLQWQAAFWALGLACLLAYFWAIAAASSTSIVWSVMPLYVLPSLTIGAIAFFQRLLAGTPTKRTRASEIRALPLSRLSSLPYRIPHLFGLRRTDPPLDRPAPNRIQVLARQVISFLPTAAAMLLPVWRTQEEQARGQHLQAGFMDLLRFFQDAGWYNALLVASFMAYTVFFAAAELARHWRRALGRIGG